MKCEHNFVYKNSFHDKRIIPPSETLMRLYRDDPDRYNEPKPFPIDIEYNVFVCTKCGVAKTLEEI